jgi:hypothetical protein
MMPKSGYRFSENIMLQQYPKAGWRFEEKPSRFSDAKAGLIIGTSPTAAKTQGNAAQAGLFRHGAAEQHGSS